ncbi:DUF1631 family protein [Duganella qianjiadongensis]|uniref:DUF1631 family protein n=1 Tax=Duganella qianjiadongensis TaxID=2692176 RepID=A0ABW9VHY9_9BURK|nr:DUF1631 family protein [Duganella qianjiadongensis]MYM39239.1 DUF1631 family protein [Duganella qianjiadongensis]
MVANSTSTNARLRAVSARHAVLEELIELARQQLALQLPALVLRLTQCLLDVSNIQPDAVQARLRAGNGLRLRQFAFLPLAGAALEQALRRELATLAPGPCPPVTAAAPGLSLVPYEEMDQQLALAALARPYEASLGAVLADLNAGLARLFQRDTLRLAQHPFRPAVFMAALWQAWCEFAADDAAALSLFELCQPALFPQLAPVLQALHVCLQGHLVCRPERPVSAAADTAVSPQAGPTVPTLPPAAFAVSAAAVLPPSAQQRREDATAAGGSRAAAPARHHQLAQQLRQFFASAASEGGAGSAASGAAGSAVSAASVAPVSALLAYLAQLPLRQDAPPAAGAAMPVSAGSAQIFYLPRLKAALPQGSLSRADEGTLDLLAAVFETLFRDHHIAQEIRELMLLLQLPVLKAALADQAFFFKDQHPARKLIDLLSRLGWEQRMLPDTARLQAMQRSVERVGRDGAAESAAFADAVNELEAALAVQEQQDSERMAVPIAAAIRQEKALVARRQAEAALAARLEGSEVLELVRDFLSQRWIEVLAFAYRVEDEKSGAIDHATCAMDELLWSVQPKLNLQERRRLLLKLPALLGALNKWLDLVQWQGEERTQFFAELAECHAAIVRAPLDMPADRQLELAIAAGQGDAARRAPLAAEVDIPAQSTVMLSADVASLQRGMWLEFDQSEGGVQQVRLAWVSPLRSLYIFAAASRQEAYSLGADELARRFEAGSVRIVCDTDVVGSALSHALARAA